MNNSQQILLFKLNPALFLRDPQATALGQSLIRHSIEIIDKVGFDAFTFKRLATATGSPEASVYRYFENKHRLLLYLIDWYWCWVDYRLEFENQNIKLPRQRLKNCIKFLVEEKSSDPNVPFVDEQKLERIVNSEFEKTYLTRHVDADNRQGLFLPYKAVCGKIASLITAISPKYRFPRSLVSTVMLSANHQLYYAQHLPSLTDLKTDSPRRYTDLAGFLETLILHTIDAGRI